jgi:hypothetical protein
VRPPALTIVWPSTRLRTLLTVTPPVAPPALTATTQARIAAAKPPNGRRNDPTNPSTTRSVVHPPAVAGQPADGSPQAVARDLSSPRLRLRRSHPVTGTRRARAMSSASRATTRSGDAREALPGSRERRRAAGRPWCTRDRAAREPIRPADLRGSRPLRLEAGASAGSILGFLFSSIVPLEKNTIHRSTLLVSIDHIHGRIGNI